MEDRAVLAALDEILWLVDSDVPCVGRESVERWPTTVQEWAGRVGLLRESEVAAAVACDACDSDHVEEVIPVPCDGEQQARYYISCPGVGRVFVHPNRLRRDAIVLDQLATIIHEALGAAGPVRPRIPGRLWSLGRIRVGSDIRPVFFARGISWDDGDRLLQDPAIGAAKGAVLFTARVPPNARYAAGLGITFMGLQGNVCIEDSGLVLDEGALDALRASRHSRERSEAARSFPTPPGVTWTNVWIAVDEFRLSASVNGRLETFEYDEIGFVDCRTGAPNSLWRLLHLLASNLGSLDETDPDISRGHKMNLKRYVSSLRERMSGLFVEIDGDPIPFHKSNKERVYRAKFNIGPIKPARLPGLPARIRYSDVVLTEGIQPSGFDVIVRTELVHVSYCFAGMGSLDGSKNAAGERMRQLLADGAPLEAPPTDNGMLELGASLSTILGIDESPFDFEPSVDPDASLGRWRPLFSVVRRHR